MNALGGITRTFHEDHRLEELERKAMPKHKARVVIEGDYEFDREVYGTVYDAEGNDVHLSPAARDALTPQQMLEHDQRFLDRGDFGVDDVIAGLYNMKVKLELVEE